MAWGIGYEAPERVSRRFADSEPGNSQDVVAMASW